MSVEMSKSKRILFLITVFLTNIVVMGDNVMYPIINNLYGEFYTQIGLVNYVVSGPLLIIFIVSLLATSLLKKMTKKTMLIIGGSLFAVSTIFGAAVHSALFMAVMRTFTGIGQALVNVAAMALIAEVYVDENKRGWVMGIYNSVMAGIGMIFSLVSGLLATSGWQNSYRTYWVAVPMVVMMILFLPSIRVNKENETEDAHTAAKGKKQPFSLSFWVIIAAVALVTLAFNMMAFYVSVYVAEHNLGNEAVAGLMSSCISCGSMLFCLIFGWLYGKYKKNALMVCCGLLAVALALLYFIPNVAVTAVACLMVGGSYGMTFSFSYAHGSAIAPEGRVDDAIGIATAAYAISGFLSTYISTWLMGIMSSSGAFTPTLIVPLAAMVVCIVIYPLVTKEKKEV